VQSRETLNEHDRHDHVLVARYAAADAYETEIDQAQQLVESCPDCSALAADIRLIATRTSELPVVRRPRDFRISTGQAEQLRGSWLDRLMRNISAPGWAVVRPLAGAALAIGVVLVVVGALPLGSLTTRNATDAAPGVNFGIQSVMPSNEHAGAPDELDETPALVSDAAASAAPAGGSGISVPQAAATGVHASASVNDSSTQSARPTAELAPQKAGTTPVPAAQPTSVGVASLPSPQPSLNQPAAPFQGHASVPVARTSELNQAGLVLGGTLLVLLASIALAVVWFAHRRYSDPLVR